MGLVFFSNIRIALTHSNLFNLITYLMQVNFKYRKTLFTLYLCGVFFGSQILSKGFENTSHLKTKINIHTLSFIHSNYYAKLIKCGLILFILKLEMQSGVVWSLIILNEFGNHFPFLAFVKHASFSSST